MPSQELIILLLTYNNSEAIGKSINDLLAQTFKDFTLYIFDDCSTDDTLKILENFKERDSRILLFKNNKNKGVLKNFYDSLDLIFNNYPKRSYFLWACPDDGYSTEYLENCVRKLRTEKNLVVAQTYIDVLFEDQNKIITSCPISLQGEISSKVIFNSYNSQGQYQPYNQCIHGVMKFSWVRKIYPKNFKTFKSVLLCELFIVCLFKMYGGIGIIPKSLTLKKINVPFEVKNPNDPFTKNRESLLTMFLSCFRILSHYFWDLDISKKDLLKTWKFVFKEYFLIRLKVRVRGFLILIKVYEPLKSLIGK